MKIALVCTHGGHLTETFQILDAVKEHEIFFATHPSSRDKEILALAPAYFFQSIEGKIHLFLSSFFWAYKILKKERPDIVLSLGAEIAIPFFICSKVLKIKTIYIESWCRVNELSLTGKLLYPIADEFWVQWPQLLNVCGSKAQFHGSII